MRKKTALLTLVLTLAMVFGSISSVFASAPAPQETIDAIQAANVHVSQRIASGEKGPDEVTAEAIAINFQKEVAAGKYKVVDTQGLVDMIAKNPKLPIIDTMPAGWWAQRHIPGAMNQVVGANNSPEFKIITTGTDREDTKLLALAKKLTGAKQITKYYNKKTKKWVTKKPAKKYLGKSKKVWINKDKPIVVYCGFTGCARSHQAAMYLKKQGFTKVYRYVGGIAAWVDAGNEIEGTDVDHFRYMKDEEWARYGIEAGDLRTSDYLIDVRPDTGDNSASVKGYVPGAAAVPVVLENGKYTAAQQEALKEEYAKADGKRIVIICVSGNMLAKNAMDALKDAGVDMSNVTYLKGGFNKTWSQVLPTLSADKTSLSVPAWVASDQIKMNDYPDQTHHVLVNETGKNAPVALLNTKALPAQVYRGLEELGAKAGDGEGTTEGLNAADHPSGAFIHGTPIDVTFKWDDAGTEKAAGMSDFFSKIKAPGLNSDEENVEPYDAKMVFGGCIDTLNEESMGNPTGCITCTFSCWIGTVSNSAYGYGDGEALVNRAAVPAKNTPVTVVYTVAE